jgi:hypothetical protein
MLLTFLQTYVAGAGQLAVPATPLDRSGVSELPALFHPFYDRRGRIARALGSLRHRRERAAWTVVTGLPGVGKTAFVLVVAYLLHQRDYPGPVVFVRLGGDTDQHPPSPAEVLGAILVALGHPRHEIDSAVDRRRTQVTKALQGRRALLVLDDAASDQQVADIDLPGGCAAIVTSKLELTALQNRGAPHIWLGPLTPLQGVRLLAMRLGRRRV